MGNDINNGFWGESEHGIDDKGRLLVPLQYRENLGNEFVVTRGPDRVILVFRLDAWEQIEGALYRDEMGSKSRILQRLFSSRFEVSMDGRGRFSIPKVLREWAQIEPGGCVILLGQGRTIEIWSQKIWKQYQDNFTSANTLEAAAEMGLGELFRL